MSCTCDQNPPTGPCSLHDAWTAAFPTSSVPVSRAQSAPDRPRHLTPIHDVRALRSRLVSLLAAVDDLAVVLVDPPGAPELSDYEAPVTWQGQPYRVVGSVTRPGTEQITISIEPRSADHG